MTASKSRCFILGAFVFLSLAMGAAAFFFARPSQTPPLRPAAQQTHQVEVQPAEKVLYRYIVQDYQGKIAIFSSAQQQTPQYVTDFDTAVLPRKDREMLQKGIGLRSEEELQMLLEDYGS